MLATGPAGAQSVAASEAAKSKSAARTGPGAAQREREAALLAQLATADAAEAARIDRELQAQWRKSGSVSMDLLLKRGRDAIEVSDYRAAIEHLTALTDHAPDFAEGWHARATAFFQADLFGPAVADLERCLALNPNNYRAIYGLATLLETFGDDTLAYQAYERAADLNPHFKEAVEALDRLRPDIEGKAL
ncbi:MAG: tetratricopeptide repeat protein [Marinibacterium sp.]